MGVVYLARDTRLGRAVALKAVSRGGTDSVGRARLQREARAAASLAHPGIATVYALEEDGDDCYLITEYLQGRTLRDELVDGPLPVRPVAAGRDRHRRRGRRRPRPGPRAPRSQARERDAHGDRRHQGARLRPGARNDAARHRDDADHHPGRRADRDARLHGARADPRPDARRPHRHLRGRRAALRAGRRRPPVRRRRAQRRRGGPRRHGRGRRRAGPDRRRGSAAARDPIGAAAGRRRHRREGPGQEPRGALRRRPRAGRGAARAPGAGADAVPVGRRGGRLSPCLGDARPARAGVVVDGAPGGHGGVLHAGPGAGVDAVARRRAQAAPAWRCA